MKRGGPLRRVTPLQASTPLRRRAPLVAAVTAAKPRRAKDTGPARKTRQTVAERSGGWCEWPGCTTRSTDLQHRLGRKAGGRHGAMRALLNGAAWLLAICRHHHRLITSAAGEVLEEARRTGWVLLEGQDAATVPTLTRHWDTPVLLRDDGTWTPAE